MKYTFAFLLLAAYAWPQQATIKHVIFIVKENRSMDSLFGQFIGAPGTPVNSYKCYGTAGGCVGGVAAPVAGDPTANDADCPHTHRDFITDYNSGAMNKFNVGCPASWNVQYNATTIPYYWSLANGTAYAGVRGGLSAIQASAMAPSFPSHQIMFAGTSSETRDNPGLTAGASPNGVTGKGWSVDAFHYGTCRGGTNANHPCNQANGNTDCAGGGSCMHDTQAGVCCTQGVACDFSTAPSCPHGLNSDCAANQFCTNGNVYQGSYYAIDVAGSAGAAGSQSGSPMTPGTCTAHPNVACVVLGTTQDPACTALSDTCNVGFNAPDKLLGSRGMLSVNVTTIADMLDTAGVSWGFYNGDSLRNTPDFYSHIWYGPDKAYYYNENTVKPAQSKFYAAASTCTATSCSLPAVSWVQAGSYIPTSDSTCTAQQQTVAGVGNEHPSAPVCIGESWTKDKVNAVMNNPYLVQNTVIFVLWDDFGGFYDHVAPAVDAQKWRNGFRVPVICVSKFCKSGYQAPTGGYVFESMLALIENMFLKGTRLPGALFDTSANDLGTGCVAGPGCTGHNGRGMLDLTLQ